MKHVIYMILLTLLSSGWAATVKYELDHSNILAKQIHALQGSYTWLSNHEKECN